MLKNLIDDSEATDWQASATQGVDGAWNVDGKQATIDLAGSRPQTIRHVQVSALIGPVFDPIVRMDLSQSRFTALRQFEIWTCNDQAADCSQDDSYQRAYASAADAFPADAPRPVAPMLLLRNFTFSPVRATHLRIVARNPSARAARPTRASRTPTPSTRPTATAPARSRRASCAWPRCRPSAPTRSPRASVGRRQ